MFLFAEVAETQRRKRKAQARDMVFGRERAGRLEAGSKEQRRSPCPQ